MTKTVVLIDDDQDDLDILKETLTSIDPSLSCISFIYPVEAIKVVTRELIVTPDYIFTDINMPVLTGDQCVREFRKYEEFNDTIITVLSTTMRPEVSDALKKLGANFTFKKPNSIFEYKQLLLPVFKERQILSDHQT